MIYLIAHLGGWLLLTAAFAGLAGWAFAARRAAPAEAAARRERDKLMRDLITIGVEEGAPANGLSSELEREADMLRRRAELDAARVTELEHALETARARADEAQGHAAELQRALDRVDSDADELTRLREVAAVAEADRNRTVEVEIEPQAPAAADDDAALQAWRLRYFEQRVRYLENHGRGASAAAVAAPAALSAPAQDVTALEWRARVAEARVAHLEEEARRAFAAPAEPVEAAASPFAADADTDVLLRWRMLYLEKRVAHLQGASVPAAAEPALDSAPDPDRWKWRARYLEARVRHLEARLEEAPTLAPGIEAAAAAAPLPVAAEVEPEDFELEEEAPQAPPLVPAGAEERPAPLYSPRGGAPDDLTLIDGVSQLQQTTLNSLGVFHFEQIAAWTPENVAWVDQYLRLRGRIVEEEWVEQAQDLVQGGPDARRVAETETA